MSAPPDFPGLDAAVRALVHQDFAEAVATTFKGQPPPAPEELFLALACARGDAAALALFETRYLSGADAALRKLGLSRAAADDVKQALRLRLLVRTAAAGPPLVCEYAGRGALRGLIRVAATRMALNLARQNGARAGGPEPAQALAVDPETPELQLMRASQAVHFKRAMERALAELSARERNLLRLQLIERLSVDQIGALFEVHRASAARWLVRARERLEQRTRHHLFNALKLSGEEVDDAARLVRSQLQLSLARMLA